VLERLLALARTEIGGGESLLRDLPQLATPEFAPASALSWLAGWLAFELPRGMTPGEQRAVLPRVADLYRRRGTVAGLIEFIHVHTGVRARVVEWPRERRIWQLGVTSALGFDTTLPSGAVDGIVVADREILRDTRPPRGCQEPERVVVGHAVVGADRPLAHEDFGSVLFDDHAHRITVIIPAGQAQDPALRDLIREVVATEIPAHVTCEVCFVEPRLRIGLQSRIGIETVVAGEGAPLRLSEAHLGEDSRLGGRASHGVGAGPGFQVGQQARIGSALALG
jgi:phage tail-like protein